MPKQSFTLSDWVSTWYLTYKESKHALTTRQVQYSYINCHIIPYFKDTPIESIQTTDIQAFINYLLKSGNKSKLKHYDRRGQPLSSWTVKKIRALLLSAFDVAVRDGIVPSNPVRNTETISVQSLRVANFTPAQQEIFLSGTKRHRFYLAYQLLFFSGCRRSEILGLTWDCIDFERFQISIRKVLVNIDGNSHLKDYPKTKASIRTIPIHQTLINQLAAHLEKQQLEASNCSSWNNSNNLVFCNKDGSPHSPTYFLHNFKAAIRRLGLPTNLRVHSTRHTFATNLLQLGVSISDVQHLGGWSDTRVVLDIYSHTVQESHRTATELLFERNLRNNKKTSKKKRR